MARAIVNTISASGGGVKNYYENPNAEADVTTGVTITAGATVTEETTNQIADDQSYLVTQDNSGSNADIRFAIIDIDKYVTDEALIIRSGAYIRTDAADSDGDVTFGIWNDTDSVWMHGPEPLTGGGDLNIVSTLLATPLEAGKTYQGRLLRTDNTNGREMIVDKLELSPDNGGAILTEADEVNPGVIEYGSGADTFVPTISNNGSVYNFNYSVTGKTVTCWGRVSWPSSSGATSGTIFTSTIELPLGPAVLSSIFGVLHSFRASDAQNYASGFIDPSTTTAARMVFIPAYTPGGTPLDAVFNFSYILQ